MTRRTKFKSVAVPPCVDCPWLIANAGRRNGVGWYSKRNLAMLWAGLRRGERMTCHPTDPDNPPSPVTGRQAPEGATTLECRGALILVQREVQRAGDILKAGGTFADYRRAHPRGLTRKGMAAHLAAIVFGGIPVVGGPEMARPNLNDASVAYAKLEPWEPR